MNWKMLIPLVAVAITAKTTLADSLNITETDESLAVTYTTESGTVPVDATITSILPSDYPEITANFPSVPKEAWKITLSRASALFFDEPGAAPILIGEPEDPNSINIVGAINPLTFLWFSDVSLIPDLSQVASLSLYQNWISIPEGADADGDALDLVLSDVVGTATPDAGSSLALLGMGTAALATFRRKLRA
jgi:hypothetical protein